MESATPPKFTWAAARDYFSVDLSLHNLYDRAFLWLFVVDLILRLAWLDKPTGSLIFDEWYYVNVARVILGLPQSIGGNGKVAFQNVPTGLDPNHEHPPLAKLLIALSTWALGNNGYGWRIPSVIFGSICILAFYLLLKKISTYQALPLLATFLFSFDNLAFVHSRIATLDIFCLGFMLLGIYWYFSGHSYLSALGMSLSSLTKITGVAGFVLIVGVHLVKTINEKKGREDWEKFFSWFERYTGIFVVSFFALLSVMDHFWVGYSWAWPHIQYILSYSTALTSSCPSGIISCPWQWLVNQLSIPYLHVNVTTTSGTTTTSYLSVNFTGQMNPAISYLTIPSVLYCSYNYYQRRDDLSLLVVALFAVTYLPFYPAVIVEQRVTYLFYILQAVPAICAGIAYMIVDTRLPKYVVLFYLAVVLYAFCAMFPFNLLHGFPS
ncbi:MAG TPA: glycosyltransferase family 39 protein [Candidatus Acidoferrales bacterium]|nr:glycosyltransferase family 39 protein [Candidatus Acidoferrales bacterium]